VKLPGFPVAVPGETVASVVARHLERTAGPRSRSLSVLGLRQAAANALVPSELAKLADSMPDGHPWSANPDEIVVRHTLVPLYLFFADPKRSASVLRLIQTGSSANPAASLGLTAAATRKLTTGYKYCVDCVAHDVSKRGFSVAYREHQPPFVRACVLHLKPLVFGCSVCWLDRKALSMWRMAGRCRCEAPQNLPAYTASTDPIYETGVLWLAKQVRTILSNDGSPPKTSLAVQLREALVSKGFAGRTGLDSEAIKSALIARYGSALLQELGASESTRTLAGSRWPSRLLGSNVLNGERTPDVLRCLLLAGLVANEIGDLAESLAKPVEPAASEPSGYSTAKELGREMLATDAIETALRASTGKIAAAALSLGVSPSRLAVDMQRQGICSPLSATTAKRLGSELIANVRRALQTGTPKIEIQRSLGISEWSIQLIELDSPALRDEHRIATIKLQRERHRGAVLQHRHLHPSASRSEVVADCPAAFDWLWNFDSDWLESNLPSPKRARDNGRGPRKNWPQVDLACVALVQTSVRSELEKPGRPTRLTTTHLLRTAGALNKAASLVPLATAEAKRYSESEDAYLRRRIKWALHEYSSRHVPVSMNQLRRVAALHPDRLIRYRDYIAEVAQELELTIDARCALSPLQR
jgi:Tn7-like transposition protein D